MKRTLGFVALTVAFMGYAVIYGNSLAHAANPSPSCASISNDENRYYCQAKTSGNQGFCGAINTDSKRYYCQAVATREPNRCNAINDDDTRNMCKAEAR